MPTIEPTAAEAALRACERYRDAMIEFGASLMPAARALADALRPMAKVAEVAMLRLTEEERARLRDEV